MSERIRTIVAITVIGLSLGVVIAVLAGGPTGPGDRVNALAVRLKCPICDSESIADSPAQVARDSYDLIAQRVDEGWTDDEILGFFVSVYGPSILLDPPARGATAILWLAPIAALAVGGVVIAGRIGKGAGTVSDEDRRRIAAELEARR